MRNKLQVELVDRDEGHGPLILWRSELMCTRAELLSCEGGGVANLGVVLI